MPAHTEHEHPSRTGILLINLGSPDAPSTPAVRRYLREFLSDPRVLDIHPVGRAALLNLIILPFRSPRSADAYRSVWMEEGSPLLVFSRRFCKKVERRLPNCDVRLAMRYGRPSIEKGLAELRELGCDRLIAMPLYPHYASSSFGSSVELVYREASRLWDTPFLTVVPPFYDDPGFIDAFAKVARPVLDDMKPDHVLFSYHGLPERHVQKSDPSDAHCLRRDDCCAAITQVNRNCYRAQCFATTDALRTALDLTPEQSTICFQSRLGRTPWIQPYTDLELPKLVEKGVRKVAVLCPSFVADCLETVEEIGIRAVEDFRAAGGDDLALVPSLNDSEPWVEAAVNLIRKAVPNSLGSLERVGS